LENTSPQAPKPAAAVPEPALPGPAPAGGGGAEICHAHSDTAAVNEVVGA